MTLDGNWYYCKQGPFKLIIGSNQRLSPEQDTNRIWENSEYLLGIYDDAIKEDYSAFFENNICNHDPVIYYFSLIIQGFLPLKNVLNIILTNQEADHFKTFFIDQECPTSVTACLKDISFLPPPVFISTEERCKTVSL